MFLRLCLYLILMGDIEKCFPYSGQLNGYKFARNKYYELQIEFFINHYGHNVTAQKAYEYFNIPDLPWHSLDVFKKNYYRIRKSLRTTNEFNITITPTLESMIETPSADDFESIVKEMKHVMERLQPRSDHLSLITKQTLMSAVCKLDDDGNVQNEIMMNHIVPKLDYRSLQKCVSIKHDFNTTDTSLLHDPNAANEGKARREFDESVDQHMVDYWLDNTTPDPNTAKVRVLKDEKGQRIEKRYHYCHKKYSEVYENWVLIYKEKYGDYKRVPCLNYFMNLKPVWEYETKSGDYSLCKKCYNFNSMTKALLRRLNEKNAHLIGTVLCPNHDWYAMDSVQCSCSECLSYEDTLSDSKRCT